MKVILGERQSGKTAKLFEEVNKYLEEYPEGTAIFVSPYIRMSSIAKNSYTDLFGQNDRIVFTSWQRYINKIDKYCLKRSVRAVFIDQFDYILRYMCDASVLAVTGDLEEEEHE